MSDSVRPHRRQSTRLPRPRDSPGKNTGVGCHFLLQCMKVKSESEVAQPCPTLSDPMDCSPPGSSIHGICQARVLEWVAIAFSIIEAQGLVKVDFFPILDLFGSNQFMSVPSGPVSLVLCPLPSCFTGRYFIHFSRLFAIQTSLKRQSGTKPVSASACKI